MDGDNNNATKQHDPSSFFPSSLDLSQHVVQQQMSPHHSPESFRRPTARATVRARRAPSNHGQGIAPLPDYAAYGYPAAQQPSSLAVGDSLQNVALPFQAPLSPESVRQQYSQRQAAPQDFSYPLQHHQQPPYDPGLVYGLTQSGPAHVPYNISLPETFQPRSVESLGSMTPQFGVPQYFGSSEHTGEYLAHYLNTQRQPAAYQQESSPNQPTTAAPYSSMMNRYNPVEAVDNMEQQQQPQQQYQQPQPGQPQQQQPQQQQPQQQQHTQNTTDLENAYRRYQHSLAMAYTHFRAKRLQESSKLVLEISTWLVDNAEAFGLHIDNEELRATRLKLWKDLNNCWLGLFQAQIDITTRQSEPGQPQHTANLLTVNIMEHMSEEVIKLCDKLEPLGLVDYQMGLAEEEIISVASQCIDILSPGPSQPLWRLRSSRSSRSSRPSQPSA